MPTAGSRRGDLNRRAVPSLARRTRRARLACLAHLIRLARLACLAHLARHVLGLLSLALALASLPAWADTLLNGNVTGTLSVDDSPYVVTSTVTVPAGAQLTIPAGVVVRFRDRTALMVNGTLVASGTDGAGVIFTADTNLTRGSWAGIGVQEGGSATLHHFTIDYAGMAAGFAVPSMGVARAAALFAYRGSLTATAGAISHVGTPGSAADGVFYHNDGTSGKTLDLENTAVSGADSDGLEIGALHPADTTVVTGNSFTGNAGYACRIPAGALARMGGPNTFSGNGSGDGIAVTIGSLIENATLPPDTNYYFLGPVTVPANIILTVSAGDTVRVAPSQKLQVAGILNLNGTDADGVTFTSSLESPSATSYWAGIGFLEGAAGTLSHATLRYAGYLNAFQVPSVSGGHSTSVFIYRANVSMDHVTVEYSGGDGVFYYNNSGAHALSVTDSAVINAANDGYSIASDTDPDTITLAGNTLAGVARYPILIPARRLAGLSGNALNGSAAPAVFVSGGSMTRSATMDPGGAYHVMGPVIVKAGVTLTVSGGATVVFESGAFLDVYGTLSTGPPESSPVTFTSAAMAPAPGDWGGIGLESGAFANLTNTVIRYAGQSGAFLVIGVGAQAGGLIVGRANLTANGLTCDSNLGDGLFYYNPASGVPAHSVSVTDSAFTNNGDNGVHIHQAFAGDVLSFSGCTASGNTGYGVLVMASSTPVNLTGTTANGNGAFPVRLPAALLPGISGVSFQGNQALDAVDVISGTLSTSTTVPYALYLDWPFTIAPSTTLTLAGAADVTVAPSAVVFVNGTLNAAGTAAAPISFHGPAGSAPGAWGGIALLEGAASTLSYVSIRSAGAPNAYGSLGLPFITASVLDYRASFSLADSVIADSGGDGVMVLNDGMNPRAVSVARTAITNAAEDGITVSTTHDADTLSFAGDTISGCAGYAMTLTAKSLFGLGANNAFSGNQAGNGIQVTGTTPDAATLLKSAAIAGGTTLFVIASPTVAAGASLQMDAGATALMAAQTGLTVLGALTTNGTPERPVLFTANGPNPSAGYWSGIAFGAGATGTLTGLETRYGGAGMTVPGVSGSVTASVAANDATLALNRCLLRDGAGTALFLRGNTLACTSANTTLSEGGGARLVDAAGSGSIAFGGSADAGCDFLSTQPSAVVNAGPATMAARYDYWGAPDGPNPPGSGAGVSGPVDTAYFLAAPANLPVADLSVPEKVPHGAVMIPGTAYSPYFSTALLEAGTGNPPAFQPLATLPATVRNGTLGTWDTTALPEGTYTLRLTVTDRLGRSTVATATVTVASGAPGSGDIDGDGAVTVPDAILALRLAGGLAAATPGMVSAGDVRPKPGPTAPYGEGRLSVDDATAILVKALNPTVTLP